MLLFLLSDDGPPISYNIAPLLSLSIDFWVIGDAPVYPKPRFILWDRPGSFVVGSTGKWKLGLLLLLLPLFFCLMAQVTKTWRQRISCREISRGASTSSNLCKKGKVYCISTLNMNVSLCYNIDQGNDNDIETVKSKWFHRASSPWNIIIKPNVPRRLYYMLSIYVRWSYAYKREEIWTHARGGKNIPQLVSIDESMEKGFDNQPGSHHYHSNNSNGGGVMRRTQPLVYLFFILFSSSCPHFSSYHHGIHHGKTLAPSNPSAPVYPSSSLIRDLQRLAIITDLANRMGME